MSVQEINHIKDKIINPIFPSHFSIFSQGLLDPVYPVILENFKYDSPTFSVAFFLLNLFNVLEETGQSG